MGHVRTPHLPPYLDEFTNKSPSQSLYDVLGSDAEDQVGFQTQNFRIAMSELAVEKSWFSIILRKWIIKGGRTMRYN